MHVCTTGKEWQSFLFVFLLMKELVRGSFVLCYISHDVIPILLTLLLGGEQSSQVYSAVSFSIQFTDSVFIRKILPSLSSLSVSCKIIKVKSSPSGSLRVYCFYKGQVTLTLGGGLWQNGSQHVVP